MGRLEKAVGWLLVPVLLGGAECGEEFTTDETQTRAPIANLRDGVIDIDRSETTYSDCREGEGHSGVRDGETPTTTYSLVCGSPGESQEFLIEVNLGDLRTVESSSQRLGDVDATISYFGPRLDEPHEGSVELTIMERTGTTAPWPDHVSDDYHAEYELQIRIDGGTAGARTVPPIMIRGTFRHEPDDYRSHRFPD